MQINSKTSLFGVIGYPLGHSFSPEIHNVAFHETGYNGVYLAFPMRYLAGLKYSMKHLGITGLSVTIPHKIRIRRILDKIEPDALRIGSVNTVKRNEAGLLEGYNTDGMGALKAIQQFGLNLAGKKVLIIGTGGSARAICFSLLKEGVAEMALLSRSKKKALSLARSLAVNKHRIKISLFLFPQNKLKKVKRASRKVSILKEPEQIQEFDLIIQTTPVGMTGHLENLSPLEEKFLHKEQILFDIVYNPQETPLIKMGRKKKLEVIYGYKMLLHQAAEQFRIFTQLDPPEESMEKALLKALKNI